MTKTELCEKILSYDSTARIDITTGCSASNFSITALQELVAEWKEMNVPKVSFKVGYDPNDGTRMTAFFPDGIHASASGKVYTSPKDIPEPDPPCPPDYNS